MKSNKNHNSSANVGECKMNSNRYSLTLLKIKHNAMKIVPMYAEPYKVKIQLEDTDIYRVVLVPADINMLQFHLICQEAMGWMMEHLFSFMDIKGRNAKIKAGLPEFEESFSFDTAPQEEKADRVKLSDFYKITEGKSFWYWYDFGDDWWHQITFQQPTQKEIEVFRGTPLCLEGAKACPPENIGGLPGYEHFLYIIANDIQPDKDDLMDFYGFMEGDEFDSDFFEIEFINEELSEIMEWDNWNQTAGEFMEN